MTRKLGRESFFSLKGQGYLFQKLKESSHVFELLTTTEIEDAWQLVPEVLANKVRNNINAGNFNLRGFLWEMYIFKQLHQHGHKVEYEQNLDGVSQKLDFKVVSSKGYEFYIEAKSIGPNESEMAREETFYAGDLGMDLRVELSKHLNQVRNFKDAPVILAFANSYSRLFDTPFEYIRAFFGQPGICVNTISFETTNVLLDSGFWNSQETSERGFDGVIFYDGLAPGFSSYTTPKLWLNPFPKFEFDFTQLGWEMDIYKADKDLFITSANRKYTWDKVSIY